MNYIIETNHRTKSKWLTSQFTLIVLVFGLDHRFLELGIIVRAKLIVYGSRILVMSIRGSRRVVGNVLISGSS
jgi:hypothetical protein